MNKLKVVFFGTPDFAKASLEAIHKSNHEVAGVVTVADKASGRGQKINESPVKKYAVEHQLPVFQPEKLRNPEFLKEIENLNADIFVVVAFRMMPKVLFSMPRLGTFNLHASLLPDYRGAAPINYAVINGEEKTGVTSFFINEKIDEGHILLQEETDVDIDEDAGQLHDRLMDIGAGLVVKTLDGLAEGIIEEKPQPQIENPKTAYKIFKEDTRINWQHDVEVVYNFIRGMSPYPAAFTTIEIAGQSKTLKIFKGKFEKKQHEKSVGQIDIDKNSFAVYTHDGVYYPMELQLEGKKRMTLKDFLNGFQSFTDIKIA
ncbi:methionyl-tRNA formyltransferase [Elizabethkingia anophelis]|uniref:methionyl-tRNA formyltransferase n=1 Tax=Elizabethkingia anophelis TaxID=1117645 RepID=UPI00038A1221|nr:methionyl-tRNA formyltransferase [Elizabethkingia anophelis]AVF47003.1 methionyl-tRNA formyltransferase [Elizabethkingia anophelis]AVF50993.1 methionyl-tRNA formyltransferase [Elizabethkingia anophelis]EQB91246.1 methionyl-tRNA formyltransferase [Elizabethkingia anophelis 502]MBG0504502.1 methionyl-tRNA formyltransferase [Elizabethkingia anophelis]MCT4072436.1 methionyl-tRNA formyltransferase [Elizabethkingia anophelis]